MNWQGEQVFSVLTQRLLSPPWVQRLRVTGTGIGWFVGLAIVSIPATTVLIRDPHPHTATPGGNDPQFCSRIDPRRAQCAQLLCPAFPGLRCIGPITSPQTPIWLLRLSGSQSVNHRRPSH